MFEWSDVRVFLTVSRTGSFTAAARTLHLDQTTVGRRVAALETQLGTRLFRRHRDGLVLTPAGRDLVPLADGMEAAARALDLAAAGRDDIVAGSVRLTTFDSLGEYVLAPALPALTAAHPELVLDIHTDDRSLSLTRREADLAIRLGRPAQAELVVRRLARIGYAVYGPRRRTQLDPEGGPYVGFNDDVPEPPQTRWLAAHGARVVFRSNNIRVLAGAIEGGVGLGILPCYLGDTLPLARVVPPEDCVARELWLVVHTELARTPRLRAVIGWLDDLLAKAAPALAGQR